MSGLPREAPCAEPAAVKDGTNICPLTTAEILARLKNESFMFPTWTVPSYRYFLVRNVTMIATIFPHSNLGFALLGHCLVEHVFPGRSYEDYVEQNILTPLQLTNTGFNITQR